MNCKGDNGRADMTDGTAIVHSVKYTLYNTVQPHCIGHLCFIKLNRVYMLNIVKWLDLYTLITE